MAANGRPNGNGNGRIRDKTLNEVAQSLGRYKPFVIAVVGIFAIVQFLPGKILPTITSQQQVETGEFVDPTTGEGEAATPEGDFGEALVSAGAGGLRTAPVRGLTGGRLTGAVAALGDALSAPDCDRVRGRIKVPSIYAPNCVPMWPKGSDNGGATWKGVTRNTVKVVIYQVQPSASNRALAAAGTSDSPEQQDQNRKDMIGAFEAHFETYGRHVEFERYTGTGSESDDVAAKRDAIEIAGKNPFVVFGGPTGTNTFVDEIVARQILCFCTVSQPIDNYLRWAPYVWSSLMASSQGYIHRGDYLGKRLKGGKALYARGSNTGPNGLPVDFTQKERTFGAVYYDTPDLAYKAGVDFFERYIRDKYGMTLTDRIPVKGAHIDQAGAAQEAGTVAARLKSKGITSVLWLGDPLYPALLTKEATRQSYFPEWIITGAALSDLVFFARTYDSAQWRNAFGISYLTVPVTEEVSDSEKNIWEWHHGREFSSSPSSIELFRLFSGMHLAGPKLTPATFRDGMFSYKPTKGFITQFAVSYGRGLWPWDDYLAADDHTEIWWDPTAQGPDHQGTEAAGMYRYVLNGKRFLPGELPIGSPQVFDASKNEVTIYRTRPPQDEHPEYPMEVYRGK